MSRGSLLGWLRRLIPAPSRDVVIEPEAPSVRSMLMITGDRELADTVGAVVTTIGHEFESVPDPESVRSAVRKQAPEVTILDWRIPAGNRKEIIENLTGSHFGRVPILALVPDDDGSSLEEALEAGCNDFLTLQTAPLVVETKLRSSVRIPHQVRTDRVNLRIQRDSGNSSLRFLRWVGV